VVQVGFFMVVHFHFIPIPEDLFNGPMYEKNAPLFEGNPEVFRQGFVTNFVLVGSGLGFILSALVFGVATLGIGIAWLIVGIVGSVVLVSIWKYSFGTKTAESK
jgi:uncharacterized membrane protein YeaQ/YmgE (transglycosylase-associated protein family)